MEKVLILYGSKQGKTASMAGIIASVLEDRGFPVLLKNVFESRPEELTEYKFLVLGSSTWSDGDLQSDFLEFERGMDDIDLSGHFAAAFGSGSSRFRFFCEAVRILEAKMRSQGSRILLPSLMVNDLEGRMEEESREWALVLADEMEQID